MMQRANGQPDQERPLTLDEARAEFPGDVFRLDQSDQFEVAQLVGTIRRAGRLSAIATSYFDLSGEPPEAQPSGWTGSSQWMADWIARLRERPLVPEVVRVWTLDEFGGAAASAATMLDLHIEFVLANRRDSQAIERPVPLQSSEALMIDGIATPGLVAQGPQLMGAAARVGDLLVSVAITGRLSRVVKRTLTSH